MEENDLAARLLVQTDRISALINAYSKSEHKFTEEEISLISDLESKYAQYEDLLNAGEAKAAN